MIKGTKVVDAFRAVAKLPVMEVVTGIDPLRDIGDKQPSVVQMFSLLKQGLS
jgi:hypothetical protein